MQKFRWSPAVFFFQLTAKSHPLTSGPFPDYILKPNKSAATDKKNISGVYLEEFLLRLLPSALRRDTRHRSFNNLQQGLLYTFTRNVPGNRWVVRFPRDFIDLVDIDDPPLCFFHVVIGSLQKAKNNILDILSNISCFRQAGSVSDSERNLKKTSQSLSQKSLSGSRRPKEKDVALL